MDLYISFGYMDDMSDCDGLRLVCIHLSLAELVSRHESSPLCLLGSAVIFGYILEAQLYILGALHITNFQIIEITNFFDPSQVLSLSCTDTFINKTLKYIISTVNGLLPISALLFFYYKIVPTILRIP
jgi:hypothetical protein